MKRERADTIVSADPNAVAQSRGDVSEDELNSEVEVLRGHDLLTQVALAGGLIPDQNTPPDEKAESGTRSGEGPEGQSVEEDDADSGDVFVHRSHPRRQGA